MSALENVESDEILSSQQRGRHHEVWFTPSCMLCSDCVLYTGVGVSFSDHSFLSFAALCFLQLDSTERVNHVLIELVSIRGQAFLESPLFLQLDSESRPFVPSITEWWNLLERWDPHLSRVNSLGLHRIGSKHYLLPWRQNGPSSDLLSFDF